jgi:hypothetical protein
MKTAIIFNPYGVWDFHANFEIPIYHNLELRGYNVIYLRCGLDSLDCDLYRPNVIGKRPENACSHCRSFTDRHLKNMGVNYRSVADYLNLDQVAEIKKSIFNMDINNLRHLILFDINLYQISLGSVHTHFRINSIDASNVEHLQTLRHYMVNAALTLIAGKIIFKENKPDVALIFNGRMATTRAMVELCKKHGVRYTTHERGLTRGYFLVNVEDKCTSHQNSKYIAQYNLNHPLKNNEIKQVKKWFNDRLKGTNISWKNFLDSSAPNNIIQTDGKKRC